MAAWIWSGPPAEAVVTELHRVLEAVQIQRLILGLERAHFTQGGDIALRRRGGIGGRHLACRRRIDHGVNLLRVRRGGQHHAGQKCSLQFPSCHSHRPVWCVQSPRIRITASDFVGGNTGVQPAMAVPQH